MTDKLWQDKTEDELRTDLQSLAQKYGVNRRASVMAESGDTVMLNGRPIHFVDATMLEMGYYPVWKHMSKWGQKRHRRDSAVNHVKRARKLRSRKRRLAFKIQQAIYRRLTSEPKLKNDEAGRAEILQIIRRQVPDLSRIPIQIEVTI